ncbi:MAG: TolC family protein [Cyanobacteria bacterium P01_E01_bin.42]
MARRSSLSDLPALLRSALRNGSSTLFAAIGTLAVLAIASGDRQPSAAISEGRRDPLTSFFNTETSTKDPLPDVPLLNPIPDRSDPRVILPSQGEHRERRKQREQRKQEDRRKQGESREQEYKPRFRLFEWPERNSRTSQSTRAQTKVRAQTNARAQTSRKRRVEVRSRETVSPLRPETANSEQKISQTTELLTAESETIPFNLEDIVRLTVANNTEIKNAYLARIVQKAELASARGEFRPKVEPILAGRTSGQGTNWSISDSQTRIELGAGVSLLMPTGGELRLDWLSQLRSLPASQTNEDSLRQGVSLRFTQPLLRDAGVAITKSDLDIAKLQEKVNLLSLENTLIEEITTSIRSYRTLLTQQEQVKNTRAALETAKQQLEQQQALVEAGREARFTLLRSKQTVTNFEGQLIEAQNAVKSSRLALLNQLGIDRDLNIVAVEDVLQATEERIELDPETTRQITFTNQPNYLAELLQIEISELDVLQSNNDRRWNLDLETQYDEALTSQADFSAGLVLRRNLGNRFQDEEAFKRAKVSLMQSQNDLAQLEETIETEISDRLRDIEVSFQQIQLAKEAVALAEGELQAQEALVKAGRSDNFELQQAQQDLLNARNEEIRRRIEYLNTLTDLQQTRGTTLDDWNIILETER